MKEKYWKYSLIIIIIGLGIILFRQITPFLGGLLGALTIYILVRKQMIYLGARMKRSFAALLITGEAKTGYDVLGSDTLSFIVSLLPKIGQAVMGGISSFAVNLFVLVFVLYFMLIGGTKMEAYIDDILPFNEKNTREVTHEINMIVRSNAIGIPLLAVIQGGVALIGYFIFGAPNAWLIGVLTCFATIIPMVGTALVWFPVAAYLALTGEWANAIGLAAYGGIVVSQCDNLIRFILQKKMADTHPLITIFGVVIGLSLFGFMGVIFGPLVLSLFLLFVDMFKKEYLDNKK